MKKDDLMFATTAYTFLNQQEILIVYNLLKIYIYVTVYCISNIKNARKGAINMQVI